MFGQFWFWYIFPCIITEYERVSFMSRSTHDSSFRSQDMWNDFGFVTEYTEYINTLLSCYKGMHIFIILF